VLQCVAVCCSELQCVAVCCSVSVWQHLVTLGVARNSRVAQYYASGKSLAVCCSVLQ